MSKYGVDMKYVDAGCVMYTIAGQQRSGVITMNGE